jgi:hypothetical protein
VILLPTLWLGGIPGAPQRRAVEVVWRFFRHGIEVGVYIVYVSVIGLAIQRLVARPLPAGLGGTNPFAHVLMMGAAAVAALILLRHIRADLSGRPGGRSPLRRAREVAIGMGLQAAIGGAGSAVAGGVRAVGARRGDRAEPTPWERLESATVDARRVHGAPQRGFDPITTVADVPQTAPAAGEDGVAPSAAVDPRPREPGRGRAAGRRGARTVSSVGDSGRSGRHPGEGDLVVSDGVPDRPPTVPPVTDPGVTGYGGAVPLPEEPPPDDDPPPPDDDGWHPPTTVDPITETSPGAQDPR